MFKVLRTNAKLVEIQDERAGVTPAVGTGRHGESTVGAPDSG